MSGIEVEYCEVVGQIGPGIVEKSLRRTQPILDSDSNANLIVSEVVHDIVESALDLALQNEKDALKQYCKVGDIIDEFTPRSTTITELTDIPKSIKNQTLLTPTEEEVKKFIGGMNSPTYTFRNSDTLPAKGLGDQLLENTEILTKKKSFTLASKNFAIEKKARITDLVRNSKSLISKLLSENAKPKETEWEEGKEEFLKTIELECVKPGEVCYKVPKVVARTVVNTGPKTNLDEMISLPDDTSMDSINLCKEQDDDGLYNYEQGDIEVHQKSLTFPIASTSRLTNPDMNDGGKEISKKKWNLGSRLVSYIKKRTTSKKENDQDTKANEP